MAKHTITSLAFKIIIGVASVMLMLHYAPISEIPSMYAVECYQSYHVSHHSKLYDFVMMTETANKWMKFVTFVATDHKPIGIGKIYKTVIDTNIFLLAVVEHQQGQYAALETMSKDSTPQFRIEIRFTSDLYAPCQKRQPSDFDSRRLDLFSLLRVKAASPSNRINANGLTLKILLLHDSLLFQNTIGALYRYSLRRHLRRSLANLAYVLPHLEEQERTLSPSACLNH
ncbi:uncharacterized protein LOC120896719 isoform X1 [Anopheles arabiensis]|uniref:uncharacterized protein LOC120896719 isoform X1 n=1 Tax=Anopheles arabiensis TaxID=7173 RepID=UPI001AADDA7D|nr:uncharacterized protein LOC120896719 isoform X1 [Anopheles arabiensis]